MRQGQLHSRGTMLSCRPSSWTEVQQHDPHAPEGSSCDLLVGKGHMVGDVLPRVLVTLWERLQEA